MPIYWRKPKRLKQGGESRDLFWLFCTCIRTEEVIKLFSTSLVLNRFSCGKVQILCFHKQQMNIEVFMLHVEVIYTTLSKDFLSLLKAVWKNTASMETALT